jgi:hypothetical protein
MSKLSKLLFAAFAILVIAGCESKEEVLPGLLEVRFLNASPDAPSVNIHVKGLVGEGSLSGIGYKQGSVANGLTFIPVRFGGTVLQIESVRPEGNKLEFELSDFAQTDETNYEIILLGKFADSTLDTLVISNLQTDVPAGSFRVQFVHASPDAADLVVYVTAPEAMLDGSPSLGPVGFKSAVAPVVYPAGTYQIRVALESDPLVAIYDSGPLPLPAGLDFMITMVNNTATGAAPISLIFEDDSIRNEFPDFNTPAVLRFVNAIPDAPALDLLIDEVLLPDFTGLEFTDVSPYVDLDLDPALTPETYNLKVIDSPAPGMVEVIAADPAVQFGIANTLIATGLLADVPLPELQFTDDIRPVATEAKLRFVNASNIAGTVDVYVEAPETVIDSDTLIRARLAFQTATTTYLSLAEGTYEITLTEASDPTQVLIDATSVAVVNGGIYTAVAIDSIGGIAPVQWLLMDDFSP